MPFVILAVGRTGTGKSTLANILCGVSARTSSGAQSTTDVATLYKSTNVWENGDNTWYIDTRGLDDSRNRRNRSSYHNIAKLLYAERDGTSFKVDLILWFIGEETRASRSLQREASFIKELGHELLPSGNREIWEAVLIVSSGTRTPRPWAQGAIDVAKRMSTSRIEPPAFRFWIMGLQDNEFEQDMASEPIHVRHRQWCYDRNEIKDVLKRRAMACRPFVILFDTARCKKCTASAERRLLIWDNAVCHVEKVVGHPYGECHGETELYHEGIRVLKHGKKKSGAALGWNDGNEIVPLVGGILGGLIGSVNRKKCELCRNPDSDGCREFWKKCDQLVTSNGCSRRCRSCQKLPETRGCSCTVCKQMKDQPGCSHICSKCKRIWGTEEGCSENQTHEV